MLALAGCSAQTASADGADLEGLGLSAEIEEQLVALYDAAIESGDTEVMIYAGHHDEFVPLYEAFEERFPGLTISTGSYVGAELTSTLEAERETGKHLVSVLSNPNGDRYVEQGFAEPYEVLTYSDNPALDGLVDPAQLTDEEHNYYSPWALMFNFSYNTELIDADELPQSWAELADPEWAGKLTFMNPSTPGGTQTVLTQLLFSGVIDESELAAIAGNAKAVATDQLALQGISAGEFPVQPLAATTSILNAAESGAPVESFFLPEDNVVSTEKWMLTAGAPSPDAAKLFLNYLHTLDGQQQAMAIGNFPTNQDPSLESPHGWPALQDAGILPLKAQSELRPAIEEYTPLYQSTFAE
ncbi:extracellular solute-binding protein [Leucobacter allii]|uniref:ABC transporter substrate-binding protein n=1 Tax=Leucobacter allii TaxID=2932247 RepID=UPI001FD241FF|nr:extracellular solute-binding protein [Leucobacter allii]UOR01606.1 extracellular solute-binding protein [Leucobacter allii]